MTALTSSDFKQIRKIVREEIQSETSLLLTKDDFFTWMDKICTKLTNMKQEMTTMNNRISRIEFRMDSLETKI